MRKVFRLVTSVGLRVKRFSLLILVRYAGRVSYTKLLIPLLTRVSLWHSCGASERGNRGSEVRFHMRTQNFFVISPMLVARRKTYISLFIYRTLNLLFFILCLQIKEWFLYQTFSSIRWENKSEPEGYEMLYGSDESEGAVIIRCWSILLSQMWKFGDMLLEGVIKIPLVKFSPAKQFSRV